MHAILYKCQTVLEFVSFLQRNIRLVQHCAKSGFAARPTSTGCVGNPMYQPAAHREDRLDILTGFIRSQPLGLLISHGADGLDANLLPFSLRQAASNGITLTAHMARMNPQWRALETNPDTLVVFQGPHAYVSPSFYPSKREHGKVVPTWNYIVVQARGTVSVIHDEAWLHRQIAELTESRETGRPDPWAVSDAPETFVDRMVKAIVGLEIAITGLEGKWKLSQNRPAADREGVIAGLTDAATADSFKVAESMRSLRDR